MGEKVREKEGSGMKERDRGSMSAGLPTFE